MESLGSLLKYVVVSLPLIYPYETLFTAIFKIVIIPAISITGYSLGGALATLCAIDVQYIFGKQILRRAYTFGSPPVGNAAFVESYNQRVLNTWRVVNRWDPVVGISIPWKTYRHVGSVIKLQNRYNLSNVAWNL